jgi:hypothetical protein
VAGHVLVTLLETVVLLHVVEIVPENDVDFAIALFLVPLFNAHFLTYIHTITNQSLSRVYIPHIKGIKIQTLAKLT